VLLHKLNPLDRVTTRLRRRNFSAPCRQQRVLLTYDVKKEYSSMRLYRATNRSGPWTLRSSTAPDGSYSDPATNGSIYYYRLMAIDGLNHRSAVAEQRSG